MQSLREHLALSADCSDPLLQKPGTELARGSTGQHGAAPSPPLQAAHTAGGVPAVVCSSVLCFSA